MSKSNAWRLIAGVLAGMALVVACAQPPEGRQPLTATTELSGANEVPPVATAASGTASAALDGPTLTVEGTFSGLSSDLQPVAGSPAHIHQGRPDENGPIVGNLDVDSDDQRSGTLSGSLELTAAQKQAFRDGLLYVNVHTVNYPAGELRGQFEPIGSAE